MEEKPLLRPRHKTARYEWCIAHKNWSHEKWASVVFSDESNFQLINRKITPTVRRFANEKYSPRFIMPRMQAGGGSIGFWGCISTFGTGSSRVYRGKMNQQLYRDVLDVNMLPSMEHFGLGDEALFQQDNAPCHKAKSIADWFEQKKVQVLPWPACSPDLNPIEHLWADMDRELGKRSLSNLAELEVALVDIWDRIPSSRCATLIESMPDRIEACIEMRGGHFDY